MSSLISKVSIFIVGILVASCKDSTELHQEVTDLTPPENFLQVTQRICTGGELTNPAHFAFLKQQGIQIVVSVDGMRPPVELAKEYDLSYYHLPIGYDSVPSEIQAALSDLLKKERGRYYVHCHHGKHRGPAVAAIAGLIDMKLDSSEAHQVLVKAGTSQEYQGLWRSVQNFREPLPDTPRAPLVAVAEVEPMVESMVQIDEIFDSLKRGGDNFLISDQAREKVALLEEHFTEVARYGRQNGLDSGMADLFDKSRNSARAIKTGISEGDHQSIRKALNRLAEDCRSCHKEYRN